MELQDLPEFAALAPTREELELIRLVWLERHPHGETMTSDEARDILLELRAKTAEIERQLAAERLVARPWWQFWGRR